MSKLLSINNSKLKKSGQDKGLLFASFGLPAVQTCPGADKCKSGCYATQGTYSFRQVRENRQTNFIRSKDSTTFKQDLINEIYDLDMKHPTKILIIRIHDSGDFYNQEYLNTWLEVINSFSHVIFYAYTKSIHLFNPIYLDLPENFRVIYSYGGIYDSLIDITKHRYAKVYETEAELLNNNVDDCSQDDSVAVFTNKPIGLIYHGNKNYNNTKWGVV